MKTEHPESKFVFDPKTMSVVWGKAPTKDGQLWKGETMTGDKMELAGNSEDPESPTAYWGWSA